MHTGETEPLGEGAASGKGGDDHKTKCVLIVRGLSFVESPAKKLTASLVKRDTRSEQVSHMKRNTILMRVNYLRRHSSSSQTKKIVPFAFCLYHYLHATLNTKHAVAKYIASGVCTEFTLKINPMNLVLFVEHHPLLQTKRPSKKIQEAHQGCGS